MAEEFVVEVKETTVLEDGVYTGTITRIEKRTVEIAGESATYLDVYIKLDDKDIELKWGAPLTVSERSKLGKTLKNFTKLEPGKKINLKEVLVGKKVQFLIQNEETERGTFARVVDGSIKPVK